MGREKEAERVRAERLEAELGLVSRRLAEAEQAQAQSARQIAVLTGALEDAGKNDSLLVAKAVAPLLGLERVLRWTGTKTGRVIGVFVRQVVFRARKGR